MKTRSREIREARLQAQRERWPKAWEPLEPANHPKAPDSCEPDQRGDENLTEANNQENDDEHRAP